MEFRCLKTLMTSILIILLPINSSLSHSHYGENTYEKYEKNKIELTKENVVNFIKLLPIQHKDICYQKIILETDHLKSRRAVEDNNLFGMRIAKRINTQSGKSTNGYAKYDDWRDSIVDYLLWQQVVIKRRVTKEEYYNITARIYSTNRQKYVNTLKKIKGWT